MNTREKGIVKLIRPFLKGRVKEKGETRSDGDEAQVTNHSFIFFDSRKLRRASATSLLLYVMELRRLLADEYSYPSSIRTRALDYSRQTSTR